MGETFGKCHGAGIEPKTTPSMAKASEQSAPVITTATQITINDAIQILKKNQYIALEYQCNIVT